MNTLRIICVILLPLAATWITFKKRHLMLVEIGRASHRQMRMGGALVLVFMLSMAPAWYEYAMGPFGRSYWFDRSPLLLFPFYITELLLYRHLHDQWKRSVLFKGAMQVPIFGCILTILIWGHDRYQRSKYRHPAAPSATQDGPGSMRMVVLRRRRRLAIVIGEMMTLAGKAGFFTGANGGNREAGI
jgi:hypothetical protein